MSETPTLTSWETMSEIDRLKTLANIQLELSKCREKLAVANSKIASLQKYVDTGVQVFLRPCSRHGGVNTLPFEEFVEKYGDRCSCCYIDDLERERKERQKEVGDQEYRGNTVSYVYDKLQKYGKQFDQMRQELEKRSAILEEIETSITCMPLIVNVTGNPYISGFEACKKNVLEIIQKAKKGLEQ